MEGGLTDGPAVDFYRRLYTKSRELTQTSRDRSIRHRRFYDGKEDEKTKRKLKRARQPDFTINRVKPGIEGMVGVVERGKTDPVARPRTPQDQDSSDIATQVLRFVSDENRWHQKKLACFRNMLVEGTAACIIEVDARRDVKKRRIRWEEFFYDPYSRELDFSDASYMGIAKWQHLDAVIATYPEHEAALRLIIDAADERQGGDSTWDDRPTNVASWADGKDKRLLTVEMYHQHGGTWMRCVFVGSLKLEYGPSPYVDEDDQPCNPIEAVSAYIDEENQRYGAVADMEGPQEEINVYRRKAAHRATFRQLQEADPNVGGADPEEARREAAKADGVIPHGWQVVPSDQFGMDMALLAESKAEIERVSVNPAILGRNPGSSGRQDLIRQQAGLTELAHLFSGLQDWDERCERQVWLRVRQYWTEPKFIRTTDDENAYEFVQVNEPVWGPPEPVMDPLTGFPQIDPVTRQVAMQPRLLGMKNHLARMGVDIIVDYTPDTANVAQEQFAALVDLARVGALGRNPGPILLKASTLSNKREVLDELKSQMAAEQQQGAQPDPRAEAAFRLEMEEKAAGIDKSRAQAEGERANALKVMSEVRRDNEAEQFERWLLAQRVGY